jgi:transcriptional regulator with XRE-family HTH domain
VEVKTLGDAIRKRRIELEIRQRDVAEMIGCDTDSIANWEMNRTRPRITHMASVIQFLGGDPFPNLGTLAERLVSHRTARGVTHKAFAAQLGIDPSTLAPWERGEREPEGRFRTAVSEALG